MSNTTLSSPDSKTIQGFFDAIPERYDFLNSFLSFSIDSHWRRRLIREALASRENISSILDIGAGTGTSLKSFLAAHPFQLSVGCDFSQGMLKVAKEKIKDASLLAADLHELPFADASFDLVTSSFVLRSVKDMERFLNEVKRILKPGGRFAFLDLTRPTNILFWNLLYRPYLNIYLPLVGKMVSKHREAYQFLSQSIQIFIEPTDLKQKMEAAGFRDTAFKPLTLGAATIFMGAK